MVKHHHVCTSWERDIHIPDVEPHSYIGREVVGSGNRDHMEEEAFPPSYEVVEGRGSQEEEDPSCMDDDSMEEGQAEALAKACDVVAEEA